MKKTKNYLLEESIYELKRIPGFLSKIHFFDDDVTYFAASLSFYTLFAIIPLLWIVFSVISQMAEFIDYYDSIKTTLMSFVVPGHTKVVMAYLDDFMHNSSRMGLLGLIYVLVTSVLFFTNYTHVVNRIFHVSNRHLVRSVVGFVIISALAPFFVGLAIYLSNFIPLLLGDIEKVAWFKSLYSYFLIWGFFFAVFKISAFQYIDMRTAAVVSFVTSLLWHLMKSGFLYYVVINQAYTTIYGSFSLLLFTLLWVYLSWVLVLYGLKLCSYLQYNKSVKIHR